MTELKGRVPIITLCRTSQSIPKGIFENERFQLKKCRKRVRRDDTTRLWWSTQLHGSTESQTERVRLNDGNERVCNSLNNEMRWYKIQDAMQPRIYLPQDLPNLCSMSYDSYLLLLFLSRPPLASPSPSSLYLHPPTVAQSSAKLGGGGGDKLILLPQPCSMGFRSSCMAITWHQASNTIQRMDNSFLNCICSFDVMPLISHSSALTTWFISAILHLVVSVSTSDSWTWNSTHRLAITFTATYATSSAAVCIWASLLAHVLLGPVVLIPTACNHCCLWSWNNSSKHLDLTGVVWWISCFNCSIALSTSASDHLVAPCMAPFKHTWNCLCYDVVTLSAPYSRTSIAVWIV